MIDGLPATPTGHAGGAGGDKSWPQRISKLFTSCSSGGGNEDGMDAAAAASGSSDASAHGSQPGTPAASAATPEKLSVEELGQPDCLLVGSGWSIPVHRCFRLVAKTRISCRAAALCAGLGWAGLSWAELG